MFSPDGMTFATRCEDQSARLWDAVSGRLIGQPMPHAEQLNAMAFSPDGKTILTESARKVQLWDAITGRAVGQPIQHGGIATVEFSSDGKTILTGGLGQGREALGRADRHVEGRTP